MSISKIMANGTEHDIVAGGVTYCTCSTAAGTAAKVAKVVSGNFTLFTGARVIVKFTNENSIASPTLNVNSTGAKPIMRYGTTAVSTGTTTSGWIAGAVQAFTYDGTNWVSDYWNNTTYSNASLGQGYGTCSTAAATAAKVVTLSSYALTIGGIVSVKFTYDVPASATMNINSKGAKSIYHRGAVITAGVIKAGDIGVFMYDGTQYHLLTVDRAEQNIVYVGPTEPTDPHIKVWINTAEEGTGVVPVLPRISTITLYASDWSGASNPYYQTVNINTVTASTKIDLQPTAQQVVSLQQEDIALMAENNNGSVTIYALGGKPKSNYTIQVLLTEVSYV